MIRDRRQLRRSARQRAAQHRQRCAAALTPLLLATIGCGSCSWTGNRATAFGSAQCRRQPLPLARWAAASQSQSASLQLADACAVLGLESSTCCEEAAREVFREVARRYYKELSYVSGATESLDADEGADEKVSILAEEFRAAKEAFDVISASAGEASEDTQNKEDIPEPKSATGYAGMMAAGRCHHRQSSGATHELWLDLRGSPDAMIEPKRRVMLLFFQTRSVVDDIGVALFKEGQMRAIVVDEASYTDKKPGDDWDFSWMPLVLADSGGNLQHAETDLSFGRLQLAALNISEQKQPPSEEYAESMEILFPNLTSSAVDSGAVRASATGPGRGSQVEDEELVVVAARTAHDVRLAPERYGSKMRALLLPPDPAIWAVASSSAEPDMALDIASALGIR